MTQGNGFLRRIWRHCDSFCKYTVAPRGRDWSAISAPQSADKDTVPSLFTYNHSLFSVQAKGCGLQYKPFLLLIFLCLLFYNSMYLNYLNIKGSPACFTFSVHFSGSCTGWRSVTACFQKLRLQAKRLPASCLQRRPSRNWFLKEKYSSTRWFRVAHWNKTKIRP